MDRQAFSFRVGLKDDEFYEKFPPFLDWLAPHSHTTGLVGYFREEAELHPILVYFRDGKVFYLEVKGIPSAARRNWDTFE